LGRTLQDGAKEVIIFGERVPVRAKIETLFGYSAHKDSEHLLEFVATAQDTLEEVLVVLGEPKSSLFLVQRIRDYLGLRARMPKHGESVEFVV
jgi:metallo-beta-lactamase family protein